MGLTGSILRKSEMLSFKETQKIVVEIFESLKYRIKLWNEDLRGKDYCTVSVNKDNNIGFVMYMYKEVSKADEYNLI